MERRLHKTFVQFCQYLRQTNKLHSVFFQHYQLLVLPSLGELPLTSRRSTKQNHEEGDHNPDAREVREGPGEGHESGSWGQRSGIGDAGRRQQEPAAGDRRRRGPEQADQEAEGEGGRGGHGGAEDAGLLRGGGGVPVPDPARRPGDDDDEQGDDGSGEVVAVPPSQQQPAAPVAVQLLACAQPVRLPPLPVADGRVRVRVRARERGQQLLAGGGAQPPGQLLAARGEARLPTHGQGPVVPHHQEQEQEHEHDHHGGAAPRERRRQLLRHTLARW